MSRPVLKMITRVGRAVSVRVSFQRRWRRRFSGRRLMRVGGEQTRRTRFTRVIVVFIGPFLITVTSLLPTTIPSVEKQLSGDKFPLRSQSVVTLGCRFRFLVFVVVTIPSFIPSGQRLTKLGRRRLALTAPVTVIVLKKFGLIILVRPLKILLFQNWWRFFGRNRLIKKTVMITLLRRRLSISRQCLLNLFL